MDLIVDELEDWDCTRKIKKDLVRIPCDESTSESIRDVWKTVREVRQEVVEGQANISKPQRTRNMPARLKECVITSDDVVDDEGELVHYTFYAYSEPVNAAKHWKTKGRWDKIHIRQWYMVTSRISKKE